MTEFKCFNRFKFFVAELNVFYFILHYFYIKTIAFLSSSNSLKVSFLSYLTRSGDRSSKKEVIRT